MSAPDDETNGLSSGSSIESSVARAFRKGNINFDFLQPDDGGVTAPEDTEAESAERRGEMRHGKRGLFNRGRPASPVKKGHVYLWISLTGASAFLLGTLFAIGKSVILLLAVPVLVSTLLWSLVMITLFLARPR
ncbi:MAG: hypothetical protein HY042_04105 [Spirochaetia bacterium]|nr:hypothetical protein [Spirochaetia bacterium]